MNDGARMPVEGAERAEGGSDDGKPVLLGGINHEKWTRPWTRATPGAVQHRGSGCPLQRAGPVELIARWLQGMPPIGGGGSEDYAVADSRGSSPNGRPTVTAPSPVPREAGLPPW